MSKKAPAALTDREQEACAYFFAFWWAVVALAPGHNRDVRAMMVRFGLVKPKGALALTAAGERVLAFAKAEGRPRYPHKATKLPARKERSR